MTRRSFLLASALATLALAGCGTLAPPPGAEGTRRFHDDISVGGRLSVRYQQDGKPQSVQGKFLWQQSATRTDIELASPLGQTLARITLLPGSAVLEQSGKPTAEATDASALTKAMLGWPLPVEGLRYWLQGFVRTLSGDLLAVPVGDGNEQEGDGWRVRYVGWQQIDGHACPKRIDFSRPEANAGEIALRLVIDDWHPDSK
ncbi:MAG: putative Outer-rane lipoprotein precursor [Pseudomonadota bacterium]